MTAAAAYRWIAVAMLAGVALQKFAMTHRPEGVQAYHARARAAALTVPTTIGPWVGRDVAVPVQAIRVLDPNVILSRRYVNVEDGTSAGLLFVHCADAHDMAGHFPARCYPARGWDLGAATQRDWVVGDLRVTGTEYSFTMDPSDGGGERRSVVVANCLLRPGGQIFRDMNGMNQSIIGAGGQATGAGQVQVYFDASISPARRDAAVRTLIAGYRPLIDAVLSQAVK